MSADLVEATRDALARVVDPCSIATGVPIGLTDMGMVKGVTAADGHITVVLVLTSPICWQAANIIEAVESSVGSVPGVRSVRCTVDHDADWLPSLIDAGAQRRLRQIRPVPVPPSAPFAGSTP